MNLKPRIDLEFIRAVLREFEVGGEPQVWRSGICRLECRLDKAVGTTARIEVAGFEVLSCNRQNSSSAVILFRVNELSL